MCVTVHWWQRDSIYQIYPRSFADSNGDGVGDLGGVIAHLDYLVDLKVGAIWLSPINPSPMADFGYDVSDYCDVDPMFGSLHDFDNLLAECHARGIKLLMDWVLNHTSDRHPWFEASRQSRDNPHRDWYVWRDGAADGGPPNNWQSRFAAVGAGWTLDPTTGQWYLHSFMAEQPDLNWDNADLVAAMHQVARFWLDRGVDGFRLDAIHRIAKDPSLTDNVAGERDRDEHWPTMGERLQGLRRVVDEYPDRILVGEIAAADMAQLVGFINTGDQLQLAHNFFFVQQPWDAAAFRATIAEFEAAAESHTWPAWFLANHDLPRVASKFNSHGAGQRIARAVGVMLYGLRGTPFIYQGEELGLPDAIIPDDRKVDVDGRDPQRAPLPWTPPSPGNESAGFTSGKPWLPIVDDAADFAAETQAAQPDSTLNLFRNLAALRRRLPVLQNGDQVLLDAGPDVLAWLRRDDSASLLVVINFASTAVSLAIADVAVSLNETLISTHPERACGPVGSLPLVLTPNEAMIVLVH